jgi:hypothetical protein
MPVGNGGIIGVANNPTVTVASGVWGMSAVYLAVKAGTWPGLGKTVIQTFTTSGTWTCPEGVTEIEYLVVAGGGGGGQGGPIREGLVAVLVVLEQERGFP